MGDRNEVKKPDVVIAGDGIYAGIDEDDVNYIEQHCMLVVFDSRESFVEALKTGKIEADVFRGDE